MTLICLIFGVVVQLFKQPYVVYYLPLLFGFMGTLLPACLYRKVRKRFEENELRKMAAQGRFLRANIRSCNGSPGMV